jgi:hypothetical protein
LRHEKKIDTGTGQQVTQLQDSCMMMMMMIKRYQNISSNGNDEHNIGIDEDYVNQVTLKMDIEISRNVGNSACYNTM